MVATFAAPASADDRTRFSDGTLRAPVALAPANARILAQKRELSTLFAKVREGRADRAQAEAGLASFLVSVGEDPARAKAGSASIGGARSASVFGGVSGYPTALYLNVYQMTQETTTYCGPAAGNSLIAFLGPVTSVYDGLGINQGNLAQNQYFETDYWGNTPWSGGLKAYPVPYAINRWRQGIDAGFYEPVGFGAVNVTDYENDLQIDVNSGYPLMGDAEERIGASHLVGHPPSLLIYHWFAIYGYSGSGSNTSYADSVSGTTFWSWSGNVPAYSGYDSTTLVQQMLVGRGYIW
jgi:hypothetical protein